MCKEINAKIEQLHNEGMPLKVSKAVKKILINNSKSQQQLQNQQDNNNNLNCVKCINSSNNLNNNNCNCEQDMENVNYINKKNIENINNENNSGNKISVIKRDDILAIGTYWTKILFQFIYRKYNEFLNSKLYKNFTNRTQPAHLIALLILGFVLYAIWPEMLGYGNKQKNIFITVIYLLAVATHFGALIWMTFFSGLALYFSLPRHTFGQCQHVLFPMYFTLNSILSVLAFTTFIKIKSGHWNRPAIGQATILGLCAVTEVIVRLYLSPMLITLMKVKYNFEKMKGSGKEIGYLDQKDLTQCPHYQNVNKRFRTIHMGAALSNITALVCSVIHILYLAQKISIS